MVRDLRATIWECIEHRPAALGFASEKVKFCIYNKWTNYLDDSYPAGKRCASERKSTAKLLIKCALYILPRWSANYARVIRVHHDVLQSLTRTNGNAHTRRYSNSYHISHGNDSRRTCNRRSGQPSGWGSCPSRKSANCDGPQSCRNSG